ncbi:MerR family transcriptional regulator [Massilia sp. G4R7]|uniref:MerR family transcriptional regulator n=1 Tax=Massilia phyllostachyos TaxID=2898585 RepID=A0ABS8Q8T6_9BURK|nr:MerR family transcriptional regulator [Massilia phyllostachyos]MCD2518168.1 MerR family transcriptional regulator [Massilia phyllostachyos]
MSPPAPPAPGVDLTPITDVERLTGIRQATLRAWERRYGFPRPLRDSHGERVYPPDQVERLQAAQLLIRAGVRPGQIFAGAIPSVLQPPAAGAPSPEQQELIALVRDYRVADLHARLLLRLMDHGLRRFITAFLAPLALALEAAWRAGALPLRSLRLFRQLASAFLQARLATVRSARDGWPRAVLAAIGDDADPLEAIMAEVILASLEVDCIPLGGGIPPQEVAAAAADTGAAIVLLYLGASFPRRSLKRTIASLQAGLGPDVALWIGGAGARMAATPSGVLLLPSPDAIEAAVLARRGKA